MAPEKRTFKHIFVELTGHPFFPLLFIAEAIKAGIEGGMVVEYSVLAFVATLIWILSDSVSIDVDTGSIIR